MDSSTPLRRDDFPSIDSRASGSKPASCRGSKLRRRRMHTACKICQDRKTRCDGQRPTCSTCRRRGVDADCAYDRAAVPPLQVRAQSSTATLEQRPSVLEQTQTTSPVQGIPDGYGITRRSHSGTNGSYGPLGADRWGNVAEIRTSSICIPTPHTVDDTAEVDGLATVSSVDGGECHYGASSTIALTQFFRVRAAEKQGGSVDAAMGTSEASPSSTSIVCSQAAIPQMIHDEDIGAALYPTRPLADAFVSCFWEFVHPLFPVLHKTSFMHRYDALWSQSDENHTLQDLLARVDDAIFTSTLNIVFSLGCQFSELVPAQRRTTLAQEFYQRATRLYNYEIMDSMSIPLVQKLILTGIYLQSAQKPNRCWNVIGLAIRVAQGMGLHGERPRSVSQTQLDREMRRRIWHCCLVLDRLLSMTFGRPVMISARSGVPIPTLIDDEYLRVEGEGAQPPGVPSGLGLLAYSSLLFTILDDILSDFYSSDPGYNITEMTADEIQVQKILPDIMSRNRRLDEFLEQIPVYLRYGAVATNGGPGLQEKSVEIQRQILHCRFLYTRLLLFRPIVYLTTKYPSTLPYHDAAQGSWTMDDQLVKLICDSCVRTAVDLISTIHRNLEHSHRSSPWHAIYFTFGATVLLLCTEICPAVESDVLQRTFEQSWDRSMAILDYYRVQRPVARQSIQTLKALRDSLQRHSSGPGQASQPSPPQRDVTSQMDLQDFDNIFEAGAGGFDLWFNVDVDDFVGFH